MTITYTHYSRGSKIELSQAAPALIGHLFDIGFYARESILSIGYDSHQNTFVDKRDLGIAPIELTIAKRAAELLDPEAGIALCFSNPTLHLSLTARLINHEVSSICMLEISARDFYDLFKLDDTNLLVEVMLAGSECIGALMGFGAMEVEWEPYTESDLMTFLVDGPPEYEGKPPPTGIIRTAYLNSNASLLADLKKSYDFIQKRQYTALLRKGVVPLFASL